jgi:hypothetical protein
VERRGIVYIAPTVDGGYTGYWDAGDPPAVLEQGPGWSDPNDAVAWGRKRALRVILRVGATDDTIYSAGDEPIAELADGSGRRYPTWPPLA